MIAYEWIKALHLISVMSWMAGLLYLPRLFVYHVDAEIGSVQSETFKVMERRLLKAIMTPAMMASWFFGLWLVFGYSSGLTDGSLWLPIKLVLVVVMTVMHVVMSRWMKAFAADTNTHPQRYFRIMNEVPTLIMIVVIVLAVVRPF